MMRSESEREGEREEGRGVTQGRTREDEAVAREEDRALMARVQTGDEAAFGALMERWERPVKSVIARIVLNASDAEELAQETMVRVWQQRGKFRDEAEVRPWVFSIAVNLARNRLRWWRRRPEVELREWSETEGGETGRGGEGGIGSAGDGGDLERKERAMAVRDAIAALPVELREAIVLFEFEEMSQAEIAVTVGASVKAVEARVARAREKLRVTLRRWA
ncbi:MAG: RNA polymerase subunit sigma-24 [Opitutia bacterium]|nr:sigma-70 family RNA polymerase sigma factor [Opitutaceae bacterium]PHX72497.1 MAG: RNA polymerase subunit sigma-24 [Opitutae bacterium]